MNIEDVRLAKQKLSSILANNQRVVGVGISGDGEAYRLKVNISGSGKHLDIPRQFEGLFVEVVEVGTIKPAG